jgi:hypothetical protein
MEEARKIGSSLLLLPRRGENTLDLMNRFKHVIEFLTDDPNTF